MSNKYRRIITGEDVDGKSCILSDENVASAFGLPGVLDMYALWEWDREQMIPFTKNELEKGKNGNGKLLPDTGGSKFFIEVAWPEKKDYSNDDAKEMFKSLGSEHVLMKTGDVSHPGMHRTDTVDYLIILSGSIIMILEHEEVLLEPGDTVVQGGVAHTWANRSSSPCVMLAVIIGTDRK